MKFDFDRIIDRRNTRSMKWDCRERTQLEPDVIPLWVADMDFPAPPAVVEAVTRRAEHGIYGYPIGSRSFSTAVADWLKSRHGWDVKKGWVTKSPGVVPSLCLCLNAFTSPGDGVVIQTPVYHPFYHVIDHNDRRLVRNPLKFESGRYVMDFDGLERTIDRGTRMLILCSPHNPVGRVWTPDELKRLGALCAAGDLIVISDEIHAELVFKGHRHVPLASLSEDLARRTVTLHAPSKTFNVAGLETSFAVIPDPEKKKLFDRQVRNAALSMGNIFGPIALEAAYTQSADWLDELLIYLEGNLDLLERFLIERVPRIRLIRPEGTYLALMDCRAMGMDQRELNEFFLRKARVYFNEGPMFGQELQGHVRINFGCPRPLLEEALLRIERAVNSL